MIIPNPGEKLVEKKPYKNAPEVLGTFATRSPERPNPIGVSCSYVTYVDYQNGIIGLAYIDADDGTPVLDIKPYMPSLDRVEEPLMPSWCSNWPKMWRVKTALLPCRWGELRKETTK